MKNYGCLLARAWNTQNPESACSTRNKKLKKKTEQGGYVKCTQKWTERVPNGQS